MLQLLMAAQKGGIKKIEGDEDYSGTIGEDDGASVEHKKHISSVEAKNCKKSLKCVNHYLHNKVSSYLQLLLMRILRRKRSSFSSRATKLSPLC